MTKVYLMKAFLKIKFEIIGSIVRLKVWKNEHNANIS